VAYIARDWEARLVQQGADALEGVFYIDRCIPESLQSLDAQDDPLPPGCPPLGPTSQERPAELSEQALVAAAALVVHWQKRLCSVRLCMAPLPSRSGPDMPSAGVLRRPEPATL